MEVIVVGFLVEEESLSLLKQEEIAKNGISNTQNIHTHPDDFFSAIS